jgi:hypothetical protein
MPIFIIKASSICHHGYAFPAYFCLASDLRLYNRIFRQFRTFLQFLQQVGPQSCSSHSHGMGSHFRGRGPAYVIVHLIDGSEVAGAWIKIPSRLRQQMIATFLSRKFGRTNWAVGR